jgi:hypothetical protein
LSPVAAANPAAAVYVPTPSATPKPPSKLAQVIVLLERPKASLSQPSLPQPAGSHTAHGRC